ncbi:DUF2968 domain-containing protein [Burkholderia sp. LS-044]|uniref:DUF2968 domain-containing protein n=1 Tax=Burkholderia sp. LS-044 TaxID=1459967 RepID=UPI0010A682F9|nr:DUF2968 domain-containing protein [Burkholderia sp. LS-044]THJ46795.1 DUF2968 domain-containing protein [Burkholderia sp. LS-044]
MKLHIRRPPTAGVEAGAVDAAYGAIEAPESADAFASAAQTAQPLRPMSAVLPQGGSRVVQTAEIAEVEAMMTRNALTSLRTLQTFSYVVALLLYRTEPSYYITLSQDGRLWRALHAAEFESAEVAFRHFEEQAVRLADIELRRTQLEAQNEHLVAMIEESEAQVERLRTDLDNHLEQTHLVSNRQQQVRKEVAQLEAQRLASQAQLNKTVRLIQQLRTTSNERIPNLTVRRIDI